MAENAGIGLVGGRTVIICFKNSGRAVGQRICGTLFRAYVDITVKAVNSGALCICYAHAA